MKRGTEEGTPRKLSCVQRGGGGKDVQTRWPLVRCECTGLGRCQEAGLSREQGCSGQTWVAGPSALTASVPGTLSKCPSLTLP